ncbi:MAG: 4Fe-4S dicluster domain-containing protein [Candidatus Fermentibacteraceae bacterium]|nr:4Fe-4S dicluster domain-containing protein [Candidatus Fermentibacteraceae bacterium]MBN2608639.1 4Fe-4S dicluster domain-containing protein [Candidatus Fermentibacteraceae bacterium]
MTESRYIVSPEEYGDGTRRVLRQLLASGAMGSVFAMRRTGEEGSFCYSLVSDPSMVDDIVPFYPVMPVQAARALTQLTITRPLDRPVAALLRPCEVRAFVENVKQSQGSMENLFIISCTCPGVVPTADIRDMKDEIAIREREFVIRDACSACIEFVPGPQTDMVLLMACDDPPEGTRLLLQSRRALETAAGLDGFEMETDRPLGELTAVTARQRASSRNRLLKNAPVAGRGLEDLVSMFSMCIGCRACRQACPLCNCILCDYETARTIHTPELVREESNRRGAVRVPSGSIQFQLGRLNHIAPYCTGCGQCSDVCPVHIPVAEIFIRAAELVQTSLGYSPGKDIDDAPALSTYVEGELQDITD